MVKIEKQSNNFIMSSFHEVQEQLLLSYEDGILDEDEFLLLHEQFMPKNPNFSYEEYDRFSLDEMNDAECLAEFRFRKHDLQILSEVFQIPDSLRCHQRTQSNYEKQLLCRQWRYCKSVMQLD